MASAMGDWSVVIGSPSGGRGWPVPDADRRADRRLPSPSMDSMTNIPSHVTSVSDPLSPAWAAYLDSIVPPREPELAAMETDAARTRFPIVGPAAGQFCYLIARLVNARSVFELGSGFGYSTAWFARAVRENGGGVVHHVVWDEDLSKRARRHLAALELDDLVQFHVAEAVETLRTTPGPFDLIFNDIEKQQYPASLPIIHDRLRPGGMLIVDNMLWHGRVIDPADDHPTTAGVRELTRLLTTDPAWFASLAPIRDGLIAAMKRPGA
jgi:predicted O-methyltransferase YrrM